MNKADKCILLFFIAGLIAIIASATASCYQTSKMTETCVNAGGYVLTERGVYKACLKDVSVIKLDGEN